MSQNPNEKPLSNEEREALLHEAQRDVGVQLEQYKKPLTSEDEEKKEVEDKSKSGS